MSILGRNVAKILGIGDSGTGKTHVIGTALEAGMKVRVLSAESNCLPVLRKVLSLYEAEVKAKKAPALEEGQFAVCVPARPKKTSVDISESSEKSLKLSIEGMANAGSVNRLLHNRFANICKAQSDFVDTFTGVSYGQCDDWGDDTLFVIDSMTILCESVMSHTVGDKKTVSRPEWLYAQKAFMQYISFVTEDLQCSVYMTAHPNKELDQNLGCTRIYPSNIGQALNTLLPGKFSEVVWCYREDEKGKSVYYWSTKDKLCVTRHTLLPCSDKIPQDFGLIFNQ